MITRTPGSTVTARIPRRQLWHRFFVIRRRIVEIEGDFGLWSICLEPMLRRWSNTRHRWIWARPGTVEIGTRFDVDPQTIDFSLAETRRRGDFGNGAHAGNPRAEKWKGAADLLRAPASPREQSDASQ